MEDATNENQDEAQEQPVLLAKHAKYMVRFLRVLPSRLASHDSTRMSIVFFALCGLDLLNSLELLTSKERGDLIDWIYGTLVVSRDNESKCDGFMGTRTFLLNTQKPELLGCISNYQMGHLAMTYTSLAVLVTLGDDLKRLDRKKIVEGVAAVQEKDGNFSACMLSSENDMRFVYCAATICYMLDYWGTVDKERMFQYIMQSFRYDNAFSQHLEGEAHGGTTFCALAALQLSGQLHKLDECQIERIKRWLIMRQVDGFQGRPNKPVDTCYSFWIGASLQILNAFELSDYRENRCYILKTQDNIIGGFAKWPQSITDPFHTYLGLCGLTFIKEPGISEVMPSLNISVRAFRRLKELHKEWSLENSSSQDENHLVSVMKEHNLSSH